MSYSERRETSTIQVEDNYMLNENSLIVDMVNEQKNNMQDSGERNLDDIFDEYLGEKHNLSKEGNLNIQNSPPPSDFSHKNESFIENEEILEEISNSYDQDDEQQENNNSKDPNVNPLKKHSKVNRKKIEQNIRKYFFSDKNAELNLKDKLSTIDPSDNLFAFAKLKKLKKKSEIIKEKQTAKHISMGFLDVEAELGSDNEDHDDIVKKITDSDKEDEEQEEYLKDLINDEKLEEETDLLQKKYFDDMLEQDRAQVKRVISGPQVEKKVAIGHKRNRTENEEDDEMTLEMRMKKFKSEEDDDSKDPQFILKNLYKNIKSLEKKISENTDENHNDELIEMQQSLETKIMKEIAEKDKDHIKLLFNRMKENEKILEESVINLNSRSSCDDKNSNQFFIRGSLGQMSQFNSKLNNSSFNKGLTPRVNHRNSFLHAMKNDKYFVKNENSLTENINLKQQGSFDSNSNTSAGTSSTGNVSNKNFSIFAGNPNKPNQNMNSNKSSNLSALFTRVNKTRHSEIQTGSSTINNSSKNKQNIRSPDFTPNKEKSLKNLL